MGGMTSRLLLRRAAAGTAVALTALAAGCGSDSGSAGADPASVLPGTSPVYFEVTVRPDGDLKTNVEAAAKKVFRTSDPGGEIVKAIDKAMADEKDANFKDDIDPWLGDKAAVAITSLRNPRKPDFAIAIASKDNDKAMEALKDKDTTEAEYAGVKYLRQKSDNTVAGPVGDTIVIGTENGFKSAVDAQSSDKQLDDSKGLQDARKGVSQDAAIGFVYVDIAQALSAISASQPLLASQIEPLKKLLGGATTLSAAIAVTGDAIRIETAQIGGPAGAVSGEPGQDPRRPALGHDPRSRTRRGRPGAQEGDRPDRLHRTDRRPGPEGSAVGARDPAGAVGREGPPLVDGRGRGLRPRQVHHRRSAADCSSGRPTRRRPRPRWRSCPRCCAASAPRSRRRPPPAPRPVSASRCSPVVASSCSSA